MASGLLRSSASTDDAPPAATEPLDPDAEGQPHATGGDRVRFWRPVPGLDVVCGEGTVREVPLHVHETLQLLLPASRFTFMSGRGPAGVVYPGIVYLTSPLVLHGARSVDGTPISKRVVLVATEVLVTLWGELSDGRQVLPPRLREAAIQDAGLSRELYALFELLRQPLMARECETRLLRCLVRLFASQAGHSPVLSDLAARHATAVRRARDYLHAHLADDISVDDVTHIAALSKWQLLRSFRREFGLSPHAYLMQLRLARARRLLEREQPPSLVAHEAGFPDASHLARCFRNFVGLTPTRYARQFLHPHRESRGATRPDGVASTRQGTAPTAPAA